MTQAFRTSWGRGTRFFSRLEGESKSRKPIFTATHVPSYVALSFFYCIPLPFHTYTKRKNKQFSYKSTKKKKEKERRWKKAFQNAVPCRPPIRRAAFCQVFFLASAYFRLVALSCHVWSQPIPGHATYTSRNKRSSIRTSSITLYVTPGCRWFPASIILPLLLLLFSLLLSSLLTFWYIERVSGRSRLVIQIACRLFSSFFSPGMCSQSRGRHQSPSRLTVFVRSSASRKRPDSFYPAYPPRPFLSRSFVERLVYMEGVFVG